MVKHAPASRTNAMQGLPAIRSAANQPAATPAEAERQAHADSAAEFEAALEQARAADKFGEVMEHAAYATFQAPTQIWGAKAAAEKQHVFSRWYFMAPNRAIVDTFLTQELYDSADVEARRALAHRYGTRYAALGPNHSRRPLPGTRPEDKARRARYPSLLEQLAQKVG